MFPDTPIIETHTLAAWRDDTIRLIETGISRESFEAGHIPGTVFWTMSDILHPDFRLRTEPEHFAALLACSGITPETTVVCSFNTDPATAAWLFWILTGFGHRKVLVLNGGTPKWCAEGRPTTQLEAEFEPVPPYPYRAFNEEERATLERVRSDSSGAVLVDTRSRAEFDGELYYDAPPEAGQHAGHIPGALHLPHRTFVQPDGTFRSREESCDLCEKAGLNPDQEIIPYCTVGARSSLVWFALRHILGFPNVRNYDGSWNEWSRTEAATTSVNNV